MRLALLLALFTALPAFAAPPKVVTDIHPVQLLVAEIMEGVGTPAALVPPNASPHHYAMSPSEARALQEADVVIWIGPDLMPSLASAIQTLGRDAVAVPLLQIEGTPVLSGGHDGHDHDHGDDGHDDDKGDMRDPHAWLDPLTLALWSPVIADTLAAADPGNADGYRENASDLQDELRRLSADIAAQFEVKTPNFAMAHDALGYFEARFGIEASAVLTETDDAPLGPRDVLAVQEALRDGGACFVVEPSTPERTIATVVGDSAAPVVEVDPLGLEATRVTDVIRAVADALADC